MRNFKVRCIEARGDEVTLFENGKEYKIKDGHFHTEGCEFFPYDSLDAIERVFSSKFELIVEAPRDILQVGMLVKLGDGSLNMVINYEGGIAIVDKSHGVMFLEDYDENLTTEESSYEYSIDEIYGLISCPHLAMEYETKDRELIWKRELCTKLDMSQVKELAEKQLGRKIEIIDNKSSNSFKAEVVENIGEFSRRWLGKVGTILEIKDGYGEDRCGNGICVNNFDELQDMFSDSILETKFVLVED